MSAAVIDPEWGDDWMALVDAVGLGKPLHPECSTKHVAHPCHRHEFTDQALEQRMQNWVEQVTDPHASREAASHELCDGCGVLLCDCSADCGQYLPEASCGHGRWLCASCNTSECPECAVDFEDDRGADRWDH